MKKSTQFNRRQFIAGASALTASNLLLSSEIWARPQPLFLSPLKGVNLGVITYSFRSLPSSATDLLGYLADLGLRTVELMGEPIEVFAGAPKSPPWRGSDMTDEQKKEKQAYQEELRQWRLKVPMGKFRLLKRMYKNQGVKIEVVKFRLDRMTEMEIAYCFKLAKILGAKGITLERSERAVAKVSPYADQYKQFVGYHNHTEVSFTSWDQAMQQSTYNTLNLDVGHYVAGTNESPIPLIEKYHDRILNLHLKDRKMDEGPNMPWGEGDTPLAEILHLMRKRQSPFMATIELEYEIPEGSNAVKEVRKCIEFCKDALG